jgi:hypothetical protein
MQRNVLSVLAFAASLLTLSPATLADPAIPAYFFSTWTISKDCSEQHAGPAGHVQTGLRFKINGDSADDTTFALKPLEASAADTTTQRSWPVGWSKVRLQYRPGAKMTHVPADFECVPGEEYASPYLALSNYSQTAEPWFEFEHWYGLLLIHGEPHHVLIFPRDSKGASSALVMIQDADASGTIQLDHNGIIHVEN